jgi:hypothetical protein
MKRGSSRNISLKYPSCNSTMRYVHRTRMNSVERNKKIKKNFILPLIFGHADFLHRIR